MKNSVWFNGHVLPYESVSAASFDRAWRYGDGGFETLFFNGTEVPLYERHIDRASRHAVLSGIELRFPEKWEFEAIAARLGRENRIPASARCRLTWFRDSGGFYLPQQNSGSMLIEVFPFDPETVKRVQTATFYTEQPLTFGKFSPYKKLGAATYTDAARYARQAGVDEALLLNAQGKVAETVSCNVLIRQGDHFWAPPATDGAVEGIMLNLLETRIPEWGYGFARKSLSPDDLRQADEILAVNALRGICCLILPGGNFSSRSLELNTRLPLGFKNKT